MILKKGRTTPTFSLQSCRTEDNLDILHDLMNGFSLGHFMETRGGVRHVCSVSSACNFDTKFKKIPLISESI